LGKQKHLTPGKSFKSYETKHPDDLCSLL
jgi:hypothetical protein